MAEDTPATVTMKATQLHTYHGQEYDVGDTYEADEGDVTTIEVQGKACGRTCPTNPRRNQHEEEVDARPAAGLRSTGELRTKGLALAPLSSSGSWPIVRVPYRGLVTNIEVRAPTSTHSAVWPASLIAGTCQALLRLVEQDGKGSDRDDVAAFSPFPRRTATRRGSSSSSSGSRPSSRGEYYV
jgi:hypothetical protein